MRSLLSVLVRIYRSWKFVEEEDEAPRQPRESGERTPEREVAALREAVARQEKKVLEYRRMRCDALARECEASVRALRQRLQALDMNRRRAV